MENTKQLKEMEMILEGINKIDDILTRASDPDISILEEQRLAMCKILTRRKFTNCINCFKKEEEVNNYDADKPCICICRFSPSTYKEHRIVVFSSDRKNMKIYECKGSTLDVNKIFSDIYDALGETVDIKFIHFLQMLDDEGIMEMYTKNMKKVSKIDKNILTDITGMMVENTCNNIINLLKNNYFNIIDTEI